MPYINSESSGFHDPGFEKWKQTLTDAGPDSALKIREKILESPQMHDKVSRELFIDLFDYVQKLVNQGKPLKINLLRIYLEEVKGHSLKEESVIGALILVAMCGFQLVPGE